MIKFDILHVNAVDSTNAYAFELIDSSNCEEGTVVWAADQYAGKGHGGNSWESQNNKNLTISVVLRPSFILPEDQFVITQIVSMAILNLLRGRLLIKNVCVKWPNDIFIGDRKVAGILIQNTIKGNFIDYSVIGIGLNVNQESFQSDAPNPCSIIQYVKESYNLELLLKYLLQEINKLYIASLSPQFLEQLDQLYRKNMYRYNKLSDFSKAGNEFKGKIIGIGDYGKLKIALTNGEIEHYGFKEIEFVLK